jgi:hypothetical protein
MGKLTADNKEGRKGGTGHIGGGALWAQTMGVGRKSFRRVGDVQFYDVKDFVWVVRGEGKEKKKDRLKMSCKYATVAVMGLRV